MEEVSFVVENHSKAELRKRLNINQLYFQGVEVLFTKRENFKRILKIEEQIKESWSDKKTKRVQKNSK